MKAVRQVVQGLVDFTETRSGGTSGQKALEVPAPHQIKYKTSMCRDLMQSGSCPRGNSCTFAHSQEELERCDSIF